MEVRATTERFFFFFLLLTLLLLLLVFIIAVEVVDLPDVITGSTSSQAAPRLAVGGHGQGNRS